MFISFKGRQINSDMPVMVYKNLHNGLWSIRQGGLVVGHTDAITLKAVSFKVSQSGRARVIKEGKKNVHAFVVGLVADTQTEVTEARKLTYNPYKFESFVFADTLAKAALSASQRLHCCTKSGLFVI